MSGVRIGVMAWVLTGCAGGVDPEILEARRAVVTALTDDVAVGGSEAFAASASALSTAAAALCDAPDETGLAATQAAWRSAQDAYKRTEILMFGPVVEEPWRFGPVVDTWPVRGESVEDRLTAGDPVDPSALSGAGSTQRGLPVVEYLLWAPEGTATVVEDGARCAYLAGAAADLAASGEALAAAWRDPWRDRLVRPEDDPDDAYDVVQDVLDEYTNRVLFTLENLRVDKLGRPKGDKAGGTPQPDTLESAPSGTSRQDAVAALGGVEAVLFGVDGGDGLTALVPAASQALVDEIRGLLDAAYAGLDGIPNPLASAIEDDPEAIQAAQDALRALQALVQVELAQGLGVTVAFNDNDGD